MITYHVVERDDKGTVKGVLSTHFDKRSADIHAAALNFDAQELMLPMKFSDKAHRCDKYVVHWYKARERKKS